MNPRRVITADSTEYPRLLREIPKPPGRLFIWGKAIEPAAYVAVVGSRRPTRYGLEVAGWFGSELSAAGVVVVSGMAKGIDAAAQRSALPHSVGVLGCGLDICYPPSNARLYRSLIDSATLISEYEDGTPPMPQHFPTRNRIIAGMCLGAVIVEGRIRGGAMITARLAMEFGREVFAVAGPVNSPLSEGPHDLIRDGARLVASPSDVLEDLGLSAGETPERLDLNPDEALILSALGGEPLLLDRIALGLKMPASAASAVLSRLEIRGVVTRHPGGRFARAVGLAGREGATRGN